MVYIDSDTDRAMIACQGKVSRLAKTGERSRASGRPDLEYRLHAELVDQEQFAALWICMRRQCVQGCDISDSSDMSGK